MSTPTSPLRIAIVGAGPAGLTLASLLHKSGLPISFTIFELRSQPSESSIGDPSGVLDLHPESGLRALEACGLLPQFQALTTECTESMIIANKDGVVRYQDDGDGTRPEIPRNSLRNILGQSLPAGCVRWGHKVLAATPVSSKWSLHFEDQTCSPRKEGQEEFDLIVGADGAWSKIRPAITDIRPHFSTVHCITVTIRHITAKYPSLASLVGGGTYLAGGDSKYINVQRGSLDSARIYLMLYSPSETYLTDSGFASLAGDPAQLKEKLLTSTELFSTWRDPLKALIAAGCDDESQRGEVVEIRPLYMLPVGHTWKHVPGLTLIGDAAHVMTPFAGEGVNAAMLDAVELADGIVSSVSNNAVGAAVKAFEQKMWERSKEASGETWQNLQTMFQGEPAPEGLIKFLSSLGPPPEAR